MDNQRNNKGVIALLIVIIIILASFCILLATGTISFKSNDVDANKPNNNITDNNNDNSLSVKCTAEVYDKLQILSFENKKEQIGAMGGGAIGYNVTTTLTTEHNYNSAPENNELYTNDYLGTLYVLYKNKLYYNSQKATISKYCSSNGEFSWQRTCDYSKFNDDAIKEFNTIDIGANLKQLDLMLALEVEHQGYMY